MVSLVLELQTDCISFTENLFKLKKYLKTEYAIL
jgi:hypothetical protein